MVDIDGTYFIQLGVFLLVFIFMYAFLFRPIIHLVEARRDATVGTKERAEEMNEQVVKLEAEISSQLMAVRLAANGERNKIIEQIRRQDSKFVSEAKEQAQLLTEKARYDMEANGKKVRQEVKQEVTKLSDAVAMRILGRSL